MIRIKKILLLEEVENDLKNGKIFYDKQEKGIGEYFWDSLIADIQSLKVYAGIHRKKYGLYLMFAKRFPYTIYYYIKNNIAYVTAVLPMRRDPMWIKKRLGQ
ncbi:MAG: type II toxin-antitoxin system RelE/ParE family toxin [Calditrichaeota bacterium]|nr:MAG: type II toxin-antitoxin system RelE/ParE family toxin [Calditrichota bacterium]MBL1205296.1 type II toxin-antitoxin system RelE/ParE family toxin [Calditrichota bacterium]NOG45125.1 type II toxin-antitoxin system RelE/ParE family toxin [Calditrichota bacterium]